MLITKLNLYKSEWLDLVFSNRNTNYGAYELRRTYSTNMLKSMGITFTTVAAGIFFYSVFNHGKSNASDTVTIERTVVLDKIKPPVTPPKEEPVIEATPKSKPAAKAPKGPEAPKVKTTAIPVHITSEEEKAVDPPVIADITGAIGPVNSEGDGKGDNASVTDPNGEKGGIGVPGGQGGDGNEVVPLAGLTEMPVPDGGMEGWNKFLSKNIHFPSLAREEGASGKVFISFIIEKDGSLTGIEVIRKAGYGFDEEAMRVLKKAKAWKPGMQNGKPVRVKYTIPISFTLSE